MNEENSSSRPKSLAVIQPPAYPFTARQLFGGLRARLEKEHERPMSFARLGKMIGLSKSKAYHWFELFHHPHIQAFICWLELLSPAQRSAHIESHCRDLPTLGHPRLAHSAASVAQLQALLVQGPGLTIINGGTEEMRTFVVTAMGHACYRGGEPHPSLKGIDFHRPVKFVPVESLLYVDDGLKIEEARILILGLLPKLLVSRAALLIFNGIWGHMPEIRVDILHCARRKHIIVTDVSLTEIRNLKRQCTFSVRLVTLSAAQGIKNSIQVEIRQINRVTRP